MTKGLQRSLSRGPAQSKPITTQTIDLSRMTVTVSATGAAIGWGTVVIGDFPEGNVLFLGAVAYVRLTGPTTANLSETWNGNFAIGTAPTADAVLSLAEVDIIPSTAFGAATAEVSPLVRATHAVAVSGTIYDNTDNLLELNLGVLITAADITDDTSVVMTISGYVELVYCMLLDD